MVDLNGEMAVHPENILYLVNREYSYTDDDGNEVKQYEMVLSLKVPVYYDGEYRERLVQQFDTKSARDKTYQAAIKEANESNT